MLLKVLFYSYFNNIYSCRKIEKALQENIHFMWLSGNSTPDFRTIKNFRNKRLKTEINHLFASVVKMLHELKYLSLEVQYIEGSKIESKTKRHYHFRKTSQRIWTSKQYAKQSSCSWCRIWKRRKLWAFKSTRYYGICKV